MPATLGYVIATPSELPRVRTIHNGLTIHDPSVRTIHNKWKASKQQQLHYLSATHGAAPVTFGSELLLPMGSWRLDVDLSLV